MAKRKTSAKAGANGGSRNETGISEARVQELIAAAVAEALARQNQLQMQPAIAMLADAIVKKSNPGTPPGGLTHEQVEILQGKHAKPVEYRLIRGKSRRTGSTFGMLLTRKMGSTSPGKVADLIRYNYPIGMFTHPDAGGRCPLPVSVIWMDGAPSEITNEASVANSSLTIKYKQWRYDGFLKPDHEQIVDDEVQPYNCVDPRDLDTVPWTSSDLYALHTEMRA